MGLHLLMVFLGGGFGALARYGITKWMERAHEVFSIGTIISNVLACLILGFVIGYSSRHAVDKYLLTFLLMGFCGGFSTFSTFSYENYRMLIDGQYGAFAINVLFSVGICLIAIILGLKMAQWTN